MDDAKLRGIHEIAEDAATPLLRSAQSFYQSLREQDLSKPPSTAELIDWIRYLVRAGASRTQELKDIPDKVHASLGVLVKSVEDLEAVTRLAAEHAPLKQ